MRYTKMIIDNERRGSFHHSRIEVRDGSNDVLLIRVMRVEAGSMMDVAFKLDQSDDATRAVPYVGCIALEECP